MMEDVVEAPPRLTYQDILKEERVMDDHVQDMLPICQRIARLARDFIETREFKEGCFGMATLQIILAEAQNDVQYRRKMRNKGLDIHTSSFLLLF